MKQDRALREIAAGLAAAVMVLTGAGCAVTPHSSTSGRVVVGSEHVRVAVVFGGRDRDLIRNYYHSHHLPPGLAKKGRVPPGHAKKAMKSMKSRKSGKSRKSMKSMKVHKHKHMPRGLRRHHLPADLERRLSVVPDGYVRVRVGADIVLMDGNTRMVVDIMRDVAF